jgi:hypothetical protein
MSRPRETILFYFTIASGMGGIATVLQLFGVGFAGLVVPTRWPLAIFAVLLFAVTMAGMIYFRRKAILHACETARYHKEITALKDQLRVQNTSATPSRRGTELADAVDEFLRKPGS